MILLYVPEGCTLRTNGTAERAVSNDCPHRMATDNAGSVILKTRLYKDKINTGLLYAIRNQVVR